MPPVPRPPVWLESINCGVCLKRFDLSRPPLSLSCGHTVCLNCLTNLNISSPNDQSNQQQSFSCPLDQNVQRLRLSDAPVNIFLLALMGFDSSTIPEILRNSIRRAREHLETALGRSVGPDFDTVMSNMEQFTLMLINPNGLNKALQRKILTLLLCQTVTDEGRTKALRACRSLSERAVVELILQHQNQQELTSHLWTAVRARGCQFLGPAMQEEVLRLVLLALENGAALSRKVLVMFIVQKLKPIYPQASKTSVGHVVQLLYRASCFKVSKRDSDSSLMELKEEYCTYDALRREHDSQIIQIAQEAGLRIAPEQWSALLYGDQQHKSAMQSIIDKLQTTQFFSQSVQELMIAVQRSGDPQELSRLKGPLDQLSHLSVDLSSPSGAVDLPTMSLLAVTTSNSLQVLVAYRDFINSGFSRKPRDHPNHYFRMGNPPLRNGHHEHLRDGSDVHLDNGSTFPNPSMGTLPLHDQYPIMTFGQNQPSHHSSAYPVLRSPPVVLNLNESLSARQRPVRRQASAPVRSQMPRRQFFDPPQVRQQQRSLQEEFYAAQLANGESVAVGAGIQAIDGPLKRMPASWANLNQFDDVPAYGATHQNVHRVQSLSHDMRSLQLDNDAGFDYTGNKYTEQPSSSFSRPPPFPFGDASSTQGFYGLNYFLSDGARGNPSWSQRSSRTTSP